MKALWKIGLALAILVFMSYGCEYPTSNNMTKQDVKLAARRASIQPVFYIPVLKVSFTTELEKEKELLEEDIKKLIDEKIEKAREEDRQVREEEKKEKYNSYLTDLDVWGYEIQSKSFVPLGAIAPKWAKFPERILVVFKIEKEEISAWEKEYEKDVLAISETANVSPTQAKQILTRLKAEGYTISKEEMKRTEEATLLWFQGGWDDRYPQTLQWKVSAHGSEDNIIVGYDSRGILEINPVGLNDDSRLHVEAGYFDLKDEFKPKSDDETRLEDEIERLKGNLEAVEKSLEEEREKDREEIKRDISRATFMDVQYGIVKLEEFWYMSAASGIFLGNMKVDKDMWGWQSSWGGVHRQLVGGENKGVVLTNAHVADNGMGFEIYVTEDKEVMWIVFPGTPFIRYTQDSDMYGSPAQILYYDGNPVVSSDYDCAIMVTTEVPSFELYKAKLGNSDNVVEGDPVVMVGNPSYLQKFLTEGVISNKTYDITKSPMMDWLLGGGAPRSAFNSLRNSNFWFDTPIGIGGTSGSGVWALDGPEKGKVVALHNMGLMSPLVIASAKSDEKEFDPVDYQWPESARLLKDVSSPDEFFKDYPFREATFKFTVDDLADDDPTFKVAMKACGLWVDVAGMNAGIPINKVKQFLQERGLDPDNFNWEGLTERYWEK